MPSTLEISEGLQEISRLDTGAWGVDVALIATIPGAATLDQVLNESTDLDVKSTVMPSGVPSFSGSVMTWPPWAALTTFVGNILRVEFSFTNKKGARRGRFVGYTVLY